MRGGADVYAWSVPVAEHKGRKLGASPRPAFPPASQVLLMLHACFEAGAAAPAAVVGVKLVAREDAPVSLQDYSPHVRMVGGGRLLHAVA